jgi:hypothetical protein
MEFLGIAFIALWIAFYRFRGQRCLKNQLRNAKLVGMECVEVMSMGGKPAVSRWQSHPGNLSPQTPTSNGFREYAQGGFLGNFRTN